MLEQSLAALSASRRTTFHRRVHVTQIARGLDGFKTPLSPSPPRNGPSHLDPPNLPNAAAATTRGDANSPSHHAATHTVASSVVALTLACTAPAGVKGAVVDAQGPHSTPRVGKPSPPFPRQWAITFNITEPRVRSLPP